MEFTINCPVDGSVEVGIEDVDTVVLRESNRADITFTCPHCGSRIAVSAIVPAFLLSAIEALTEDVERGADDAIVIVQPGSEISLAEFIEGDDARADAYCEYFRRQLEHVHCADDALAEIDSKRSSV